MALQVAKADYNLIQNLDFFGCRGFVQYVTKELEEGDEGVILKNPLFTVSKYCWNVIEHRLDSSPLPALFTRNGIMINDTYLRRTELAPKLLFSSLRLKKMSRHLAASSRPCWD